MGHKPKNAIDEPRREPGRRLPARPQDPRTNTRPRGNGTLDSGEKEKSARKLEHVLGH
jgi:hypothetical protein